jgi:hypothetical protein
VSGLAFFLSPSPGRGIPTANKHGQRHVHVLALVLRAGSSNDFDLVSGDPDVNLLEALFPDFLLGLEESMGGWVVGVDALAEEIVAVTGAAVLPGAGDANSILGDAAEAVA